MNRIFLDKNLLEIPNYHKLLKLFLTHELLVPAFEDTYKNEFSQLKDFQGANGTKLLGDFHKRVIEHNIRTIASYYSRITMQRLSELLGLSKEESEKFVCDLVVSKSIYAKINRPEGVISFSKRKEPADHLNDWGHNIAELLDLVEKTCHLIHRENMVHHVHT